MIIIKSFIVYYHLSHSLDLLCLKHIFLQLYFLFSDVIMSHIDDFLDNTPGATHKKGDITSVWDCYNAASKSAKIYR